MSAIIPTLMRTDALVATLRHILGCAPPPDEVLVYVDGGDEVTADVLRGLFPGVVVLKGSARIGPGGGRNLLVSAARHDVVASFDDDSFPLDSGYFERLTETCGSCPDAAVIAAHVFNRGERVRDAKDMHIAAADFASGGCAFRKSAFQTIGGFVPLPLAYGMEESDFALRVHAARYKIVRDAALRVRHDSDLSHHDSCEITTASLRNLALLAYLRYPPILWWLGGVQVARRAAWLIAHGRLDGLMNGLLTIPAHLRSHHGYRRPVRTRDVWGWLAARRRAASLARAETT